MAYMKVKKPRHQHYEGGEDGETRGCKKYHPRTLALWVICRYQKHSDLHRAPICEALFHEPADNTFYQLT